MILILFFLKKKIANQYLFFHVPIALSLSFPFFFFSFYWREIIVLFLCLQTFENVEKLNAMHHVLSFLLFPIHNEVYT